MCARTFACSVGPVHVASPSKTFEHGHMVATSKRARCPRPWLILAVLIVSCTIYMAFWKEGIGTKLSHSLWTASVPTVPRPAQMPRLCAHRIVGDESDELGTSLPAAMDTLMDRGIDCFDVDVVQCALAHNCDLHPPGQTWRTAHAVNALRRTACPIDGRPEVLAVCTAKPHVLLYGLDGRYFTMLCNIRCT